MGLNHCKITISAGFLIVITIAIMVLPLPWVFVWLIASAIHETGHLMVLSALGVSWPAVKLHLTGIRIETQKLTPGKEALCALAGPAVGISVILFSRYLPRIAVCAMIQTFCNLIPVYPLDGGRALEAVMAMLFSPMRVSQIIPIMRWVVLALLGVTTVWVTYIFSLGFLPAALYICFLLMYRSRKFSCKQSWEGVQ